MIKKPLFKPLGIESEACFLMQRAKTIKKDAKKIEHLLLQMWILILQNDMTCIFEPRGGLL